MTNYSPRMQQLLASLNQDTESKVQPIQQTQVKIASVPPETGKSSIVTIKSKIKTEVVNEQKIFLQNRVKDLEKRCDEQLLMLDNYKNLVLKNIKPINQFQDAERIESLQKQKIEELQLRIADLEQQLILSNKEKVALNDVLTDAFKLTSVVEDLQAQLRVAKLNNQETLLKKRE